jgi:multidrug resistance efflux pump
MKKHISLSIVIALTVLILSACSTSRPTQTASTAASTPAQLIAEGRLLPTRSLDESFSVPGEVGQVLVKDGDSVKAGQVLVTLSNSASAQLALAQAQQEALAAQQNLDTISNSKLSSGSAALALAQAQTAYNNALGYYQDRSNTQGSANLITVTSSKLLILDNKIGDLEKNYNNMAELSNSDVKKAQVLQDLSQARIDRVNLKKLLDYYQANPNSLDVQTLKAKLDLATANLLDAKRVWDRMQNGVDPNELATAQARVKTANAAVASAQAALDALQLSAGMAGTVVDTAVIPGQQVSVGQTLLSVADYSNWVIETDNLTEAEVVNVVEGQKVNVVLDALPDVTLPGIVTHINNRYAEVRGDITYTVTITLEKTDPRMRWGMTAAVTFAQ